MPRPPFFLLCPVLAVALVATAGRAEVPLKAPCHGPAVTFRDQQLFPPPADHDRGYDALSYDLDLRLDPSDRSVTGRVGIGLIALGPDLVEVHLDLVDELAVLEVRRGPEPVLFTHRGDSLIVHLEDPLATDSPETLFVDYTGQPPAHGSFRAGLMFRKHTAGTNNDPSDDVPAVASVSETWSAHSWWPCKDHPHDKALVSLTATVPDTLPLISNGTLEGVETLAPGWRRYRWREEYPLPTYLVSVAASNYLSWREDCTIEHALGGLQDIDLGFHVFPHDFQDAQTDFAATCDAMDFLTDMLGPYPFAGEKYDQAEVKWGGAMEHPTAISMPTFMFTGQGAYDLLVVHEMAHQWFGNSLTPASWPDIWLNEGFARYCEALWLEATEGPRAYAEYMAQIGPGHHPTLFVGEGLLGDPVPVLPNFVIYDKGAWLLHSLRLIMGDADFFGLLLDYANAPELVHGSAAREDFIRLAETASGRSLDRFFHIWLDTETVPRLHAGVEIHPGGDVGTVRITLQQLQEDWLPVAVPVVLHCGGGESRMNLLLDRRQRAFEMALDCPVDSVSIDPDGQVLMQRADSPAPLLEVSRPWPNPLVGARASFAIHLLERSSLEVRIYDARGRLLERNGLGPLEATGPASDPESAAHIWQWPTGIKRPLASGVIWLEFRTDGGQRCVRKLTWLK